MALEHRDNEVACTTIDLSRHYPALGWVRACVTKDGDWCVDPEAVPDEQDRRMLEQMIGLRCGLAREPIYTRTVMLYWVYRAAFAFGEVRDTEFLGQVPNTNFPVLPQGAKY